MARPGLLLSQAERGDPVMHITAKFAIMQVHTNSNLLAIHYVDQASPAHVIATPFSLAHFPALIGGELTILGTTNEKKLYFDGFGFGFYGARHTMLLQVHSGIGYEWTVNKRIKVIPQLNGGWTLMDYVLGRFPSNGVDLVIRGKSISGEYQVQLVHYSFFVQPQLGINYSLNDFLDFKLTTGYRLDPLPWERLNFSENYYYRTMDKNVGVRIPDSIQQDGQYVKKPCFLFHGLNVTLGVVLSF